MSLALRLTGIVVFLLVVQIANAGGISGCTVISSPGYYYLQNDVAGSGTCIRITTSDVVFDGKGHTVRSASGGTGIWVSSYLSSNVTIKNLTLTGWRYGILFYSQGKVENVTLTNNNRGIHVGAHNFRIANSTIEKNSYGIDIRWMKSSVISENDISNNTYGIYARGGSGSDFENNTVTKNKINNNQYGIYILNAASKNNNIEANTIISKNYGIYLGLASENTIKNNTITGFSGIDSTGIYLWSSDKNTIAGNSIQDWWTGIKFYFKQRCYWTTCWYDGSDSNRVEGNTISNNRYGIKLHTSNNNVIHGNRIFDNLRGIELQASESNTLYNNYFNNTYDNYYIYRSSDNWNITKTAGTNIVGGSYLGGNYWGKPDGTGFSDTCSDTNSDGICDTPYTLAANNVDHLPLTRTSTSISVQEFSGFGVVFVVMGILALVSWIRK